MADNNNNNQRSRVLFDKDAGEFLVGNDIRYDGQIDVEEYNQFTPSDVWDIKLTIKGIILLVYVFEEQENGDLNILNPDSVKIISDAQVIVSFKEPVTGKANILVASETEELLPPSPTPTNTVTASVTATPTPTISPTITPTPTPTLLPSVTLNDYDYTSTLFAATLNTDIVGVYWKPDGSKLFYSQGSFIHAVDAAVAFDIATLVDNGENVATQAFFAFNISSDGTSFLGVTTTNFLLDGTLSTPWDISTLTLNIAGLQSVPGVNFMQVRHDDNTKIYLGADDVVTQHTLGTAWDADTLGAADATVDLGTISGESITFDFMINNDGAGLYAFQNSNIRKFPMSTSWDLTTLTYDNTQVLDAPTEASLTDSPSTSLRM